MNLINKASLCWRILRSDRGNLVAHAERELPPDEGDGMNALMNRHLLELVVVFSTQGHSGMSAAFATSALEKLLRYEPLRPLTGDPGEWLDHGYCMQNKRCGRVFKQPDRFDGQAYDIDAVVFREPGGACFTNVGSFRPITFPYWPKTEYVDVPAEYAPQGAKHDHNEQRRPGRSGRAC